MAEARPPRTVGGPHDEFWNYCGQGELRIQCCDKGHHSWPPLEECEVCGSTDLEWQLMSGKGKVVSWCTFERPYYGDMLPVPWDTIMVELDEGPLFISNPKGYENAEAAQGASVKVAFIDCEDDNGTYRLPVFEAV